jgi:hypothetical protein
MIQGVSIPDSKLVLEITELVIPKLSSAQERLEVDGANEARDFLRSHGILKRISMRAGRQAQQRAQPVSQGSIRSRIAAHGAA